VVYLLFKNYYVSDNNDPHSLNSRKVADSNAVTRENDELGDPNNQSKGGEGGLNMILLIFF
jgi:hypothetical protein